MEIPAFDEARIRAALMKAWSLETAVQWTPDNPAAGQCNVTAAVIHDLFGVDILRTRLSGAWHYYNRAEGRRVDFTDSQFSVPDNAFAAPERYGDEPSTREAALAAIPDREVEALRSALLGELGADHGNSS